MNEYNLPDLLEPLDFSTLLSSLEQIQEESQRKQDILNKLYPPRKPTTIDYLAPLIMMAGAIGAGAESPYGQAMLGGLGGYTGALERKQEEQEKRRKEFEDFIEKLVKRKIETASLLQDIEKERIKGLETEKEWYEKTYPAEQRLGIPKYQEILGELNIPLPTTEEITQRVIAPGILPFKFELEGRLGKGLPPLEALGIPEFKREVRKVPILPEEEPKEWKPKTFEERKALEEYLAGLRKEPKVIVEGGNIYTYNPNTDEFTFRTAIPRTKEELEKIELDLKKKRAELETEYAKGKLTEEQYNTELKTQKKIGAEISKIKVETLGKIGEQVEPPKPGKLEEAQEGNATIIYQKLIEEGKGKLNEKAIEKFVKEGFAFSTKESGDIILYPKSLSSNTRNILEKRLNEDGFTLNPPYVLQRRQPQKTQPKRKLPEF